MTKKIFVALLTVCVLMLTGCSCEHVWAQANCLEAQTCTKCQETKGAALGHDWQEATCEIPKTCARCGEIDGKPLGHTPEERNKVIDAVACSVLREQYCLRCDVLISSETSPLDTLVQNDLFLFTPEQFMERLTLIAEQHSDSFTYEYVPNGSNLQVLVNYDGNQSLIQFFHADASPVTSDEYKTEKVWCVSLSSIGESNATFRQYFILACDPVLDQNTAFETDIELAMAYLSAAQAGASCGYLLQNELLYEELCVDLGQDNFMYMMNIYASDFR